MPDPNGYIARLYRARVWLLGPDRRMMEFDPLERVEDKSDAIEQLRALYPRGGRFRLYMKKPGLRCKPIRFTVTLERSPGYEPEEEVLQTTPVRFGPDLRPVEPEKPSEPEKSSSELEPMLQLVVALAPVIRAGNVKVIELVRSALPSEAQAAFDRAVEIARLLV